MGPVEQTMFATTCAEAVPVPRGFRRIRSFARGSVLTTLGALPALSRARPSLRFFYCHHIFDDEVTRFDACLAMLSAMGRFVSTETAVKVVHGEMPISENLFHLSFDDGYRNIVTNALPVLRRRGVPAIFFVPTGYVGDPSGARIEGSARIELTSWAELEAAAAAGLEIGSHTRSHARFTDISSCRAAIETKSSGRKPTLRRTSATAIISRGPMAGPATPTRKR